MEEKNGILKFFKRLIKKEMPNIDKEENIDIQSVTPIDLKQIIEDELIEPNLKIANENYEEILPIEEEVISESKVSKGNIEDNSNLERVTNSMVDMNKIRSNPCEITNDLKQSILKVEKHLLTPEQLERIGVTINLGHIENNEVLDVAFKFKYDFPNPCGVGTVPGETLLKAVVLVGTVYYSWILYDTITNEIVYDGTADAITAYSVYDIVQFDEDSRPTSVTAKFSPGTLNKVDVIDDENLDFYIFRVTGTVDLIGV